MSGQEQQVYSPAVHETGVIGRVPEAAAAR